MTCEELLVKWFGSECWGPKAWTWARCPDGDFRVRYPKPYGSYDFKVDASEGLLAGAVACMVNRWLEQVWTRGVVYSMSNSEWYWDDGGPQIENLGEALRSLGTFSNHGAPPRIDLAQVREAVGRVRALTEKPKPDPYLAHRRTLHSKGVECGLLEMPEEASSLRGIRRDHIEQLKREMDRKLVVMATGDDCWDGEA